MKRIPYFFIILIIALQANAQSPASVVTKKSKDFLVLGLSSDSWGNLPDSIGTGFSHGFHIALTYDFPLKEGSNFSVAPGLGFNGSHMKLKDRVADIGGTGNTLNFKSDDTYKSFHLITTYLEIPVELRYRRIPDNANVGFKASAGLKLGTLLNVHSKGLIKQNGFKQVDKISNKRYFEQWRVAAIARVGYGHFGIFAAYSLTPLLESTAGAKIYPLSVGLAISGF